MSRQRWGIHVCPQCGTRVDWRGEEPPICGMHFPERVEAEYVEVVPVGEVKRLRCALEAVAANTQKGMTAYEVAMGALNA